MLAGPDAKRNTHGVLGDAIEATRVVLLERHSLRVMRELMLDVPHVFEDIAPRKVVLARVRTLKSVRAAHRAVGPTGRTARVG